MLSLSAPLIDFVQSFVQLQDANWRPDDSTERLSYDYWEGLLRQLSFDSLESSDNSLLESKVLLELPKLSKTSLSNGSSVAVYSKQFGKQSLHVYDVPSFNERCALPVDDAIEAPRVALSSSGKHIAIATQRPENKGSEICLRDIDSGEVITSFADARQTRNLQRFHFHQNC